MRACACHGVSVMEGQEGVQGAVAEGAGGLDAFVNTLFATLGEYLPRALGVLAILLVGWLAAILVRALVKRQLTRLKVNQRVWSVGSRATDVEGGVAVGAYYTVWALALMASFNALNLEVASEPLAQLIGPVFGFVPRVMAAGVLSMVAWLLASMARQAVTRALGLTSWDESLSEAAGMSPISQNLGQVCYWLVLLIFVPGILEVLGLSNLLDPIQAMVTQGLVMLPNIFGAAVIAAVGWTTAKILRSVVSGLLVSVGADDFGERVGLKESSRLSELSGIVVQVMVVVPTMIAALDTLRIEALSQPAREMLSSLLQAVPNLLAAAAILTVTFLVAPMLAGLVSGLLVSLGADSLPSRLGLSDAASQRLEPSRNVGRLMVAFVVLFATTEAASLLGFEQLAELVEMFIRFGGQILLGTAILLVGYFIAKGVHDAVERVGGESALLVARISRVAILCLVVAMGLRAMGVADNIVDLAFGLILGAVAVAFALAFGLGGREAAGRLMGAWFAKLHPHSEGGDKSARKG